VESFIKKVLALPKKREVLLDPVFFRFSARPSNYRAMCVLAVNAGLPELPEEGQQSGEPGDFRLCEPVRW